RAGALDAHHASFAAWPLHGIGLDHGVVLLVDPALGANVGTGQELLKIRGVVVGLAQGFECLLRRIDWDWSFPGADGTVVERRVVGERFVWDVSDEDAVM